MVQNGDNVLPLRPSRRAITDGDLPHQASTSEPAQPTRQCRVFLCHSSGDKPAVRELYGRLRGEGFDVWLDEMNIFPGQDWDLKIRQAVRAADLVIVCLSRSSIGKTGYVQREIRMVLDLADEQPGDRIYLIPARLEKCEVPDRLTRWQWVDLFDPEGYDRLVSAMRIAAERLELPATADGLTAHSSQGSAIKPESGRGPATEAVTPPHGGRGGAAGSYESRDALPLHLSTLRDYKDRLSVALNHLDMSPDELDSQAREIHEALVMHVYKLMRTEVAQLCGARWDSRSRQQFADTYRGIANKWPIYREALAELERARIRGTPLSDAMTGLERPRSEYITALLSFHDAFSATLDFLFPP